MNRESFKDIPGSSSADVNTGYDLAGRRLFARFTTGDAISSDCTAANTGIDYCYDAAGRLTRETSYGREVSFAYDVSSNRSRIAHDDGQFWDIDNDKLNRVTSIRENGVSSGAGVLIAYAYDPLSRRDSATRSSTNGAATDYAFDNASRLTALAHDFAGGATNDQSYGFSYTAASQLSLRSASNDAYTWPIAAVSRTYNRNGLNQYTTTTGTGATTFTHDQRGNLVSDGVRRFCYDLENRLLRVDDAADTNCSTPALTLSYDPLGRLHEASDGSVTRQFLYDGDALIAEYDGSSISRRFVHGPGVDEPVVQYDGSDLNTRIHLFVDRQGSIIAANGATTTTYRYGPYGETDNWPGSRFRYTGQIVLDPDLGAATPVGLYQYKARVYDPVLGRFLQTDPVGYEDDLNLYAYVRNDPLNLSDPSGEEIFEDGKLKITISFGGSGTAAIPTSGMPGVAAGGDLVFEIGIAPNNPDSLVPRSQRDGLGLPPINRIALAIASAISVDRVGAEVSEGTSADNGAVGMIADADVGEIGASLGTIADREGTTGSVEIDAGTIGGEVFTGGELAGSGFRISGWGPGLGIAVTRQETKTLGEEEDD